MSDTHTFDSSLSTPKDKVRFRIGDVNGRPQWFLTDATINAVITDYPENLNEVCAQCCESIAAQCAQLATQYTEKASKEMYGDRANTFRDLAKDFRNQVLPGPDAPIQTGASFAD